MHTLHIAQHTRTQASALTMGSIIFVPAMIACSLQGPQMSTLYESNGWWRTGVVVHSQDVTTLQTATEHRCFSSPRYWWADELPVCGDESSGWSGWCARFDDADYARQQEEHQLAVDRAAVAPCTSQKRSGPDGPWECVRDPPPPAPVMKPSHVCWYHERHTVHQRVSLTLKRDHTARTLVSPTRKSDGIVRTLERRVVFCPATHAERRRLSRDMDIECVVDVPPTPVAPGQWALDASEVWVRVAGADNRTLELAWRHDRDPTSTYITGNGKCRLDTQPPPADAVLTLVDDLPAPRAPPPWSLFSRSLASEL